jgi:hypothetical protein
MTGIRWGVVFLPTSMRARTPKMQVGAHLFIPGRPHPCWPVPLAEQRRLVTVARLALHELQAGDADQALVDLDAVVDVVSELLHNYHVEDAPQTVLQAAGAIESALQDRGSHADAAAACEPLIEVFAGLLCVVTLKRLHDAQDAASLAMP